jgi:predicted transcriptional regulator
MPNPRDLKRSAHALVDSLPADADWDDVMYEVYVRQAIEAGEKDIDSGKTLSEAEVRSRLHDRLHRSA